MPRLKPTGPVSPGIASVNPWISLFFGSVSIASEMTNIAANVQNLYDRPSGGEGLGFPNVRFNTAADAISSLETTEVFLHGLTHEKIGDPNKLDQIINQNSGLASDLVSIATDIAQLLLNVDECCIPWITAENISYESANPLATEGTIGLGGAVGIVFHLTTIPERIGGISDAPERYYSLGEVAIGRDPHWESWRRLQFASTLILPLPQGLNAARYRLEPGVAGTYQRITLSILP